MMKQRMNILTGGAILAAGAAIVGGAFTAGGVTDSSDDQFIGGSLDVTIEGAVITDVSYTITENEIDSFVVQFQDGTTASIEGRALEVALIESPTTVLETITCTAISASPHSSTCTVVGAIAASDVDIVKFTVEN